VATPYAGKQVRVEVDGVDRTGAMTIPNTGAWTAYQTITKTGMSLSAGIHVIRVFALSDWFNLNWLSVAPGPQ
jgi:hypothetical protein